MILTIGTYSAVADAVAAGDKAGVGGSFAVLQHFPHVCHGLFHFFSQVSGISHIKHIIAVFQPTVRRAFAVNILQKKEVGCQL